MVLKYLMIIRELTLTLHRIDRYPLIIFNEFTSGCIPFFNHLKTVVCKSSCTFSGFKRGRMCSMPHNSLICKEVFFYAHPEVNSLRKDPCSSPV